MSRLWTDYLPLEDVQPALRNPKQHDVDALVALIVEHGYMHIGILDERTGRAVAGHGRKEALWLMFTRGMPRPPQVDLAEDGRGWLIPVQRGWASRDDRQAEEVLSALNRAQDFAGVNAAIEWLIFDDLNAHDPSALDRLGVTDEDMERLFAEVNPDLPDITGLDDDGPGRADPGPEPGQDDDAPLADGPSRPTIECPMCQHRFESRV